MQWSSVQLVEVALFTAVAVPVRLVFGRLRRRLFAELKVLGSPGLRSAVVAADTVTALVYAAFAVAAFPFDFEPLLIASHYDAAFDAAATFAVLVAIGEVTSLLTLQRTAQHLEQWPA